MGGRNRSKLIFLKLTKIFFFISLGCCLRAEKSDSYYTVGEKTEFWNIGDKRISSVNGQPRKILAYIPKGTKVEKGNIVGNFERKNGAWGRWISAKYENKAGYIFVPDYDIDKSKCLNSDSLKDLNAGHIYLSASQSSSFWLLPNHRAVRWGEHDEWRDLRWYTDDSKSLVVSGIYKDGSPCSRCADGSSGLCGRRRELPKGNFLKDACVDWEKWSTPGECRRSCETAQLKHYGFSDIYVDFNINFKFTLLNSGELRSHGTIKQRREYAGKERFVPSLADSTEYWYCIQKFDNEEFRRVFQGFEKNSQRATAVPQSGLNVRKKPNIEAEKVGLIAKGTKLSVGQVGDYVEIDGKKGHWVEIGKDQWVFDAYIEYEK